jgi:heme/copper-type cytochrome/quinol oxidase subunit 2
MSQGLDTDRQTIKLSVSEEHVIHDPLRLLRATSALVLPTRVTIRFLSSSEDITHSWAVPALGIKMDCVPGRLFCLMTNITRDGIYFGQCSELCG